MEVSSARKQIESAELSKLSNRSKVRDIGAKKEETLKGRGKFSKRN